MERWHTKVLALFIIFVVIFFFTALPIAVSDAFHKRGKRGYRALSILNCFGGGVFFGAYLLHMTPEVRDILEESLLGPYNLQYALPEFFIGLGFFFLMFVEKAIHYGSNKGNHHADSIEMTMTRESLEPAEGKSASGGKHHSDQNGSARPVDDGIRFNGRKTNAGGHGEIATLDVKSLSLGRNSSSQHGNVAVTWKETLNGTVEKTPREFNGTKPTGEDTESVVDMQGNHDPGYVEGHGHTHNLGQTGSLKSIILLIALSLDCIFEGMSLGLQRDTNGVWNLLVAILSHEFVIAFSLGLQLTPHNSRRKVLFLAFIYGLTCPVGIAIGTPIYETNGGSTAVDITSGVLQAMSAGVFVYCTFFEILIHEVSHEAPITNIIAVFLGYGLMAGFAAIPDEANSASDGGLDNSTSMVHAI